MRVTTDRIPNSSNLQKEVSIPLGVIVKPYGELQSVILKHLCYLGRGNSIYIIREQANSSLQGLSRLHEPLYPVHRGWSEVDLQFLRRIELD